MRNVITIILALFVLAGTLTDQTRQKRDPAAYEKLDACCKKD